MTKNRLWKAGAALVITISSYITDRDRLLYLSTQKNSDQQQSFSFFDHCLRINVWIIVSLDRLQNYFLFYLFCIVRYKLDMVASTGGGAIRSSLFLSDATSWFSTKNYVSFKFFVLQNLRETTQDS